MEHFGSLTFLRTTKRSAENHFFKGPLELSPLLLLMECMQRTPASCVLLSRFQTARQATAAALPPTTPLPPPGLGRRPPATPPRASAAIFFRPPRPNWTLDASWPLVATCGFRRPCSRRRAPHATGEYDPDQPRAARRRAVHAGTSGSRAHGWIHTSIRGHTFTFGVGLEQIT